MSNIVISTNREILHALADRHGFTRGEMVEAFLALNENYKLLAIAIRICQSRSGRRSSRRGSREREEAKRQRRRHMDPSRRRLCADFGTGKEHERDSRRQ